MEKIDIVLPWVDGEDPSWLKEYQKYARLEYGDSRAIRYRDFGTLKYIFRGFEKFMPWINKIFFITCGQVPEWMNVSHPKLELISHSDYIPAQYLPTFNSHTIELNLHRINNLSEHFIYFNDDTYIVDNIKPSRFFKDGRPCDIYGLNALQPVTNATHYLISNILCINNKFNKQKVIANNWTKWFSLKNGVGLLRTMLLLPFPYFTGFIDPHQPNSFLKSTLNTVWELYGDEMDATCRCRFRKANNLNQYIFRYYQLVKGISIPKNVFKTSKMVPLNDSNVDYAIKEIKMQNKKLLCINDSNLENFESTREQIINAFNQILSEESSFEK